MRRKAAFTITGMLTLIGCANTSLSVRSQPAACRTLGAQPTVQVTLMFGLTTPDHQMIQEQDWQNFLQHEVTPRFPMGLTVLSGEGQWRADQAAPIEREPSRLVWIVTSDTSDLPIRIEAIRWAYRSRFHQQSVGVNLARGCSAF